MSTLKELLLLRECEDTLDRIASWAYGQERECPEWFTGKFPESHRTFACPTCHGTGTIREPGLVERLLQHRHLDILQDLREELGVE